MVGIALKSPLQELQRLNEHPLVQPLYAKKCAIEEQQRTLEAELAEAQARLSAVLTHDFPFPVRAAREARQRIDGLQEAAETMRATLMVLGEELAAAERQAREEVKPQFQRQAVEGLRDAEAAMSMLLKAQGAIQELEKRARKFGITVPGLVVVDHYLPARLVDTRKTMAKLVNAIPASEGSL